MAKNTNFVAMLAREVADILVDAKRLGIQSLTVGDVMRALDVDENVCNNYDNEVLDLSRPFVEFPHEMAEKLYSTVN